MSYKKRLQAKLDYATAKEAAEVVSNRGGAAGSRDPYPKPKPSMTCVAACPMGAYGLLMHCKGVEECVARGDDTQAPGSEADDLEFQDGLGVEDDLFDSSGFAPSYNLHEVGAGVPAMPTVIRPAQTHRKFPLYSTPLTRPLPGALARRRCTTTLRH